VTHCSEHGLVAECSSMILMIHENMINRTNHIVEHVFVDIVRSIACNHNQSQHTMQVNIPCV
jgi:hypothetical protein